MNDLRRQEIGKYFLRPHVVEPVHRHQVPEPHVRRLMSNKAGPPQLLRLRRRLLQHHARLTIKDRTRMLHPAVLKGWYQREIEFPEGIGNTGIFLKPVKGDPVQVKDDVTIPGDLLGVRLSVKHP